MGEIRRFAVAGLEEAAWQSGRRRGLVIGALDETGQVKAGTATAGVKRHAGGREALLAIGEVKWLETMGIRHLDRLRHIRGLLTAQGRHGAATARLLCFSGAGFTAELTDEATRSAGIRLLTPADLYTGIL